MCRKAGILVNKTVVDRAARGGGTIGLGGMAGGIPIAPPPAEAAGGGGGKPKAGGGGGAAAIFFPFFDAIATAFD